MSRNWNHHILELVNARIFLIVVKFSHIVQFIDDELLNISFVDLWTALKAEDTILDHPDLVLGSAAGGEADATLRHF
jgi:hypothetical protein